MPTFAAVIKKRLRTAGAIAQLVEQRTENPCVPGSIPGGTTLKRLAVLLRGVSKEVPPGIKLRPQGFYQ